MGRTAFQAVEQSAGVDRGGRDAQFGRGSGFLGAARVLAPSTRPGGFPRTCCHRWSRVYSQMVGARLYAFATAHPELELRMTASLKLMDFDRDDIDVAIRFGPEPDLPGVFVQPILDEWVTPMMHPRLAEEITRPERLREATLLHQEDLTRIEPDVSWSRWFDAAGLGLAPRAVRASAKPTTQLTPPSAGAGVVLGRISLAAKDLENGRLVAPFELSMTMASKTRFICAQVAKDRRRCGHFWIGSPRKSGWILPLQRADK